MFAPAIELYPSAEQSAFAAIMADLIRTNVDEHPQKREAFRSMRGRVALVAEDAESAITLIFHEGRLSVHGGLFGVPDLVVRGTSEALIDLSRMPPHPELRFLPDVRSPITQALGRALFERKLRIGGALSHASLLLKLARVLSIY